MKTIITCLAFLGVTLSVNAQLTGAVRTNFSEVFMQSCFSTQQNLPENKGLSDQILYRYCKCSANYVADSMSNGLVRSIESGDQKMNPQILQLAGKYCAKNYNKF